MQDLQRKTLEYYAFIWERSLGQDRQTLFPNLPKTLALQHELELQLTKIQLIEALIEVYEHTCDPLESVRLIQIVADTMALRPRVNLEATYFRDSYASEVKALTERLELYGEVIRVQRRTEQKKNEELRQF